MRLGLRGTRNVPSPATREHDSVTDRFAEALATRLLDTRFADSLIDGIVQALMRDSRLEQLAERAVRDLAANPAIDALVDRQVERILPALHHSEALRTLVQEQAAIYLLHLERHPEEIRRLIQEESQGTLRGYMDAIRGWALSADDAVEAWVRRLLRRT